MILADDLVDRIEEALKAALNALPKVRDDEQRQIIRRQLQRGLDGITARREELA